MWLLWWEFGVFGGFTPNPPVPGPGVRGGRRLLRLREQRHRLLRSGGVPGFPGPLINEPFVAPRLINSWLTSSPSPPVSTEELRGSTPEAAAAVLQWVNFADSDVVPPASTWVFPTLGILHYNKQVRGAFWGGSGGFFGIFFAGGIWGGPGVWFGWGLGLFLAGPEGDWRGFGFF